MRTLEDADIRRLVIETAQRAPVMPEFTALVGGPGTTITTVSSPHRHRSLLVAAAVLAAAGLGYSGLRYLDPGAGSNDQPGSVGVATESPTSAPAEEAPPDKSEMWAILPDPPGDYRLSWVGDNADIVQMSSYESPSGGSYIALWTIRNGERVDPDREPFGIAATVNGHEAVITTLYDPQGNSGDLGIRWWNDGRMYMLSAGTEIGQDGLITLAESVVLVPGETLPDTIDRGEPGPPLSEPVVVATVATPDGERVLSAASDDGEVFALHYDDDPQDGSVQLVSLPALHFEERRTGPDSSIIYGLVDAEAVKITLTLMDGSERPVEIQSRDDRRGVGFFMAELDGSGLGIKTWDADGKLIVHRLIRPTDYALLLTEFRQPPHNFVTEVLGWDLGVTDAPRLAYTGPEPGDIAYVRGGPSSETVGQVSSSEGAWLSVATNPDIVAIRTTNSIKAAGATVVMETPDRRVVVDLDEPLTNGQWTYLDFPGLGPREPIAVLILYRDETGHIIGALSPEYLD